MTPEDFGFNIVIVVLSTGLRYGYEEGVSTVFYVVLRVNVITGGETRLEALPAF